MWFYPDSHSVFFPKTSRCVILFPLHFNKFSKTLLTIFTYRGIFLVNPTDFVDWLKSIYKDVVSYHRETQHFSEEKSTKELTAPQHTRFILPPIHPTKSSLRCVGGIFLLWGTYLENFMSRPNVIPTFRQRRCTNRGRNCVRSKR